ALRIDASTVEVCCAVHPEAQVDADNLRARLADPDAAAALMDALHALPEQFTVAGSRDDRLPPRALAPDSLRALSPLAEGDRAPLWIGRTVTRETALQQAAADQGDSPDHPPPLDEQLEDAIIALAPVYRLVAWSRDNDRIALDRR